MVAYSRVFFLAFLFSLILILPIVNGETVVRTLPDNTIFAEDFEDDTSGSAPDNWFQNDVCTGGTFIVDNAKAHMGAQALKLASPDPASSCDADSRHTIDATSDIVGYSLWVALSSSWQASTSSGAGFFVSLEYWASNACSPPSINCASGWTTGQNVRYEARIYLDPFNKKIMYTSNVAGTPTTTNIGNIEFFRSYNNTSTVRDMENWIFMRVEANRITHKFLRITAGHQDFTSPCSLPNGCDLPSYVDNTGQGTGQNCSGTPSTYCTSGTWGLEFGHIAVPTTLANTLITYTDNILMTDETPGGGPGIVSLSVFNSAWALAAFMGVIMIVAVLNRMHIIGPNKHGTAAGPLGFTGGLQHKENRDFTMVIVLVLVAIFIVTVFAFMFKGLGA